MTVGKITERLADMARRCGDLSPLREPVRKILVDGNRARALAGTDARGRPYAPLAPSTRKQRRRRGLSGPPLAAHGASARVVTDYTVNVQAGEGRLTFAASWPDEPWMDYHHTGTRRMPKRDPEGFREQDLDEIRALLRNHVMQGGR